MRRDALALVEAKVQRPVLLRPEASMRVVKLRARDPKVQQHLPARLSLESLEQRNPELSDNRVAYAGGHQATRAEGGAEFPERAVVDREAGILRLLPAPPLREPLRQ